MGRNYPPDIGVLADARTFLQQLLAEVARRNPKRDALKAWLADVKKWQEEWRKLTDNAMAADFSWVRSAQAYLNLYQKLVTG